MIYGKEECKALRACQAAVLLWDENTENGTPILVVRRVVGCGGSRSGKGDSYWYVKLDQPLSDEATGTYLRYVLGVNTGKTLDITPLVSFINQNYPELPFHERVMLISAAKSRLKEAR